MVDKLGGLGQLFRHGPVDPVARPRPVEGNAGYSPFLGQEDGLESLGALQQRVV